MASVRVNRSQKYVYGNTVRKTVEAPEREQRNRYETVKRHNTQIRHNRERALQMDFPYLVLLTIAALAILFICCSYLRVQSSISTSINNIATQEKLLESIKNDNDSLETRINTSIDLEHIYQVATVELGMVYPAKNQVIQYNKTESEYVRQYENIPER